MKCPACKGKGRIPTVIPVPMSITCARCGGRGRVPREDERDVTLLDKLKRLIGGRNG